MISVPWSAELRLREPGALLKADAIQSQSGSVDMRSLLARFLPHATVAACHRETYLTCLPGVCPAQRPVLRSDGGVPAHVRGAASGGQRDAAGHHADGLGDARAPEREPRAAREGAERRADAACDGLRPPVGSRHVTLQGMQGKADCVLPQAQLSWMDQARRETWMNRFRSICSCESCCGIRIARWVQHVITGRRTPVQLMFGTRGMQLRATLPFYFSKHFLRHPAGLADLGSPDIEDLKGDDLRPHRRLHPVSGPGR